jgi:hypothetical protein
MRLFFLTIPKPLKRHPVLKKDYPSCRVVAESGAKFAPFNDLEEKLPEGSIKLPACLRRNKKIKKYLLTKKHTLYIGLHSSIGFDVIQSGTTFF